MLQNNLKNSGSRSFWLTALVGIVFFTSLISWAYVGDANPAITNEIAAVPVSFDENDGFIIPASCASEPTCVYNECPDAKGNMTPCPPQACRENWAHSGFTYNGQPACAAPPTAPTLTAATPSCSPTPRVTLTWTSPANTSDVHIYRCEGASCTSTTLIAMRPRLPASYTDTAVAAGTTYRYGLRSHTHINNFFSPLSNVVTTNTNACSPTAHIQANGSDNPATIPYNSTASLTWSSSNTTSCSVSPGGYTGTNQGAPGQPTSPLTSTTVFTLSCLPSGSDDVTVTVAGAPTQCADGIDNDGDGLIDNGNDPGCSGSSDNDESNAPVGATCGDGIVNQASEKCDLGAQNGSCPRACSSSCTINTACLFDSCSPSVSPNPVHSGSTTVLSVGDCGDGVYSCTGNIGSGNISSTLPVIPTASQTCTITGANNGLRGTIRINVPITNFCEVNPVTGLCPDE